MLPASIAKFFQVVNRVNPTTHGRRTAMNVAEKLGANPGLGLHKVGDDFTLDMKTGDFIERSIYYSAYEFEIVQQFRRYVKPGATVLDIGANLGFYTVLSSKLAGPSGKVFAVEANPLMQKRLESTLDINRVSNVTILPFAASSEAGEVVIHIPSGGSHGEASLAQQDWAAKETFAIPAKRLDDVLAGERIDFVKIDVEGAEFMALSGTAGLLREHKPTLLVELVPRFLKRLGASPADVIGLLASLGYTRMSKIDQHVVRQVDLQAMQQNPEQVEGNFLFTA